MGFGTAIASGFNNYANFSGRAPRSEYWWWLLFIFLVNFGTGFAAGITDVAVGSKTPVHIVQGVMTLVFLLPNIAMTFRRLHDLNRSGWWYGALLIVVMFLVALAVPIVLRMHENRLSGYPPNDGIPTGVFLILAALGLAEAVLGLLLFIWSLLPGTRGQNRFGADPLRRDRAVAF